MTAFCAETTLLLALLRWPAAPDAVGRALAAGSVDWQRLLLLVRRHRVVSLVAKTLTAAERANLALGREGTVMAASLRRMALARGAPGLSKIAEAWRLERRLAEDGIACLHLKGAALSARAFGDPLLRDGHDIDLLLDPGHFQRADALLAADGYRRLKPVEGCGGWAEAIHRRYAHDYAYAAPSGITVEIKTRPHPTAALLPQTAAELLGRAVAAEVAGVRLAVLNDADMMLYLCLHGARHCWFRLKWLADIAALLAAGDAGMAERLLADAERRRLTVPILESLQLAHDWLAAPVPPALLARAGREPRVAARRRLVERIVLAAGPDGNPLKVPGFTAWLDRAESGLRSGLAYRCALFERRAMVAAYGLVRTFRQLR